MKTRFAPSPTGHLHIGGARTALFNWLLARNQNGVFVLRIEDTDALRSEERFTEDILASIKWLGLDYDGEPVFQSQRNHIHKTYVDKLLKSGGAYYCHCSPQRIEELRARALEAKDKPRYDGHCRELGLGPAPGAVIRFKKPSSGTTSWVDLIKGPITIDNDELDDLVLVKADGLATYNMAVVADDASMEITHVIRGDDHVNNTPRQILLYEALGLSIPQFGHVPMILGEDKKRLSKRHGATSVLAYREMGYLPQALVNYLARLGWSHGDQEIFSLPEMVSAFNLQSVGKSAAVFNKNKLDWLNSHYIKETPVPQLAALLKPFLSARDALPPNEEALEKIVLTVRERGKTLEEMAQKAAFYYTKDLVLNPTAAKKLLGESGRKSLSSLKEALKEIPNTHEDFDKILDELAKEHGIKKGELAQPLRLALTGETASPGLYDILVILGADECSKRIDAALKYQE